jgi:F0F1-type ATP synthase assembly protein I
MHPLLFSPTEDLLPFFAIFFTFMVPILAMYFYFKHKNKVMDERRLMIEKGLTPPPLKESIKTSNAKTPLNKGLNMIAIALGLLVGYFISRHFDIKGPFSIMGAILFFLGIANIISATMVDKSSNSTTKPQDNE